MQTITAKPIPKEIVTYLGFELLTSSRWDVSKILVKSAVTRFVLKFTELVAAEEVELVTVEEVELVIVEEVELIVVEEEIVEEVELLKVEMELIDVVVEEVVVVLDKELEVNETPVRSNRCPYMPNPDPS